MYFQRIIIIIAALWKTILMYVGIGLGAILVIAIIVFVIYRVKHRNQASIGANTSYTSLYRNE